MPWRVEEGQATNFPFKGVTDYKGTTEYDMLVYMPADAGVDPVETDLIKLKGSVNGEVDPVYTIIKDGIQRIEPGTGGPVLFILKCRNWSNIEAEPA